MVALKPFSRQSGEELRSRLRKWAELIVERYLGDETCSLTLDTTGEFPLVRPRLTDTVHDRVVAVEQSWTITLRRHRRLTPEEFETWRQR